MKKLKMFAAAAAFCTMHLANAQTHDVSLNIAPIIFSNYSVNYSFNFEEDMSVGAVIGYQNFKLTTGSTEYAFKGIYIAPEFRYYFNPDEGNDGFFAGAYLKYRNLGTSGEPYIGQLEDGTVVDYDQKNNGLALGIMTGKLWQTRIGLNFTFWSGIGYYLFDKTKYTNSYNPDKDPSVISVSTNLPSLDFRLGINVGYRIGN
jgi:hypothetical protein